MTKVLSVCTLRLSDGSETEVARAAELVMALGVPHHVLSLKWEESPPVSLVKARAMSYNRLLDFCKASGLHALMTAHHLDDQIGKCTSIIMRVCLCIAALLLRLSKGSHLMGLPGDMNTLAGMQDIEISQNTSHLGVQVLHPFLTCRKEQLAALCKEAGLEWVGQPINSYTHSNQSHARMMFERDPSLRQDLTHLYRTLCKARETLHKKGLHL